MMSRKAKELELLLGQRTHENELMRDRIGQLEAEVSRLREQERAVLAAITEANRAAGRIREDACAQADSIISAANTKRDELLDEASKAVSDALENANNISADADAYYAKKRAEGDRYYAEKVAEADAYAEKTRTDANIYIERCVIAAQIEVNRRRDVVKELNDRLRTAATEARRAAEDYASLMEDLAARLEGESESACAEIDACSCNCAECKGCVELPKDNAADSVDPTLCCEEAAEGEVCPEVEASVDESEGADGFIPPDEYDNPSQLMRSIYSLEGRDIPNSDESDLIGDASPEGGLVFKDELGGTPLDPDAANIPADSDLDSLIAGVLNRPDVSR